MISLSCVPQNLIWRTKPLTSKPFSKHFESVCFKKAYFTRIRNSEETFGAVETNSVQNMSKTIKVYETGGPEVLKWEDVEVGEPGPGQVKIRHTAIGLNFIDIYFRAGVYKPASYPFVPGYEGVGVVTAVGSGLTGRVIGDRVGYAKTIGSYSQERLIDADKLIPLPDNVGDELAAAMLLKGMTAQFLLRRCFKVEAGHTILVHAAAGGVGSLLCQWGKALGATVIGTVSTEEKGKQAKEDGADHVIFYKTENFVERVKEITGGEGVSVVYDSVGKDTLKGSVECLAPLGYLVNYGQSSGTADPIPLSAIGAKSLFLTRPSLMDYTAKRRDMLESAGELFAAVGAGILKIRIDQKYPLSEVAKAHADLENRKTTGSTVLIP